MGVFGYAKYTLRKKSIRASERKRPCNRGACLIDIKETGCVDMDFISLAQQTVQ
jgi:hypothetical protein